MKLVLDASMALAWIFERQDKKEACCADHVLSSMVKTITVVPALWHIEISNTLLVGERRGIITEAQIINYLNRLAALPIATDEISVASRQDLVIHLAREYQLTAYDATYLDLALRADAVLATFDTKLATAMRKIGGDVYDEKHFKEDLAEEKLS
jgi:predicted nucleic acid-binding protein